MGFAGCEQYWLFMMGRLFLEGGLLETLVCAPLAQINNFLYS